MILTGRTIQNRMICRDHYRLTFQTERFDSAEPGQFVHLCPTENLQGIIDYHTPLLRRAYSIAGLRCDRSSVEIDVIYRVVGSATRWMQSLAAGDLLSVLGPQGNCFPIDQSKPVAWLVAGGVGLPPMLWLAEALANAGKQTIAFCGAQTADLLPLTLQGSEPPAPDAARATRSATEFALFDASTVISTDDGSIGFRGHIGAAMTAFHKATSPSPTDLVVYTCGPERMMRFVAEFCTARAIDCFVCMERNMACGTGLCQSCVVPVRDPQDAEGWRYQLCCSDGPIFPAADLIWR